LYGGQGGGGVFKALRALRALRSLRPLRIIKRFDSLKIVVNALINVVPDVVNVLLLCLLFFIMFGVIFVQNLKGKFYMCQGSVFDETIAGTAKEEFLTYPKSWNKMTEQERFWFNGNFDDDAGGPQCSVWSVSNDESPTSKMVRIYMYNICMSMCLSACASQVVHSLPHYTLDFQPDWINIPASINNKGLQVFGCEMVYYDSEKLRQHQQCK
jgi:hypothetical protein